MAQRVQVQLIDDLAGDEAHESVRFVLDGTDEIDLTTANADELRSIFSKYIQNGRKLSSKRAGQERPKPAPTNPLMRKPNGSVSGRGNGFNLSSKGRVTGSILDAYKTAHHAR